MRTRRFAQRIVTGFLTALLLAGVLLAQPAAARDLAVPVITGPTTLYTQEDTPVSGRLIITASGTPSITIDVAPSNGTISYIQSNGWYAYIPSADYYGTDSFTFRVTDLDGSSTFPVVVEIDPVGDDPVAVDDGVYTITVPADPAWHNIVGQPGATQLTFGDGVNNVDDGLLGQIPMPASWTGGFPFFDSDGAPYTYTSIYTYANGLLSFNEYGGSVNVSSMPLPDGMAPHSTIIPLGGDKFAVQGITQVWYQFVQDSNVLVITYRNLANYCAACVPNYSVNSFSTFQTVLYPHGQIDVNYQEVRGYTRVVGIENRDSTHGLSLPRGRVKTGSSFTFNPQPWIVTANETVNYPAGWNASDFDPDDLDTPPAALTGAALLDNGPHLGSLTLNPDGSLEYAAGGTAGTDVFLYELPVSDPKTQSYIGQIVIRVVAAANSSPSIDEFRIAPDITLIPSGADTWSLNEGAAFSLEVVASDPDPGQTLTYSAYGLPANSAFDAATKTFTFTPDETQGGSTYTVYFGVTDDGLPPASDWKSLTITVVETNQLPVLSIPTGYSYTVAEGQLVSFTAVASDSDLPAQPLTFSVSNPPSGGSIDPTSGVFSWTPGEVWGGNTVQFDVNVNDGVATVSVTVSITVTEVNQLPVLSLSNLPSAAVPELVLVNFNASATDGDIPTQTLTFSLSGAPDGASIDESSGVFSWTPSEAQGPGSYPFSVVVSDGVDTVSEALTIVVAEVNLAPALTLTGVPAAGVNEGTPINFSASATDGDIPTQTLTFSLSGAPTGASIDPASGAFTWTPSEAQGPGSYTFSVSVYDGVVYASESVTIDVLEVGQPPVLAAIGAQITPELVELMIDADASDGDLPLQTLTYSFTSDPLAANMAIDAGTGVFRWTPSEAQGPGVYSVTITVTDSSGLSDAETFTITVSEVNSAPVLATIGAKSVAELAELAFTASASDGDIPATTPLTFSLDQAAQDAGMSIDSLSGAFTWTPTEAQGPGVFSATVTVTDTTGLSDFETIQITVSEVNSTPVLGAIGDRSVDELTALTFTAAAVDGDLPAQTLSYSLDSAALALGMTINASTGAFSWTPSEAQGPGVYPVTVTVSDPAGLSDSETLNITVNEVDSAPVLAAIGARTTPELAELVINLSVSDSDLPEQTMSFALSSDPVAANMAIDPVSRQFRWTPSEAQGPGVYTVTITVTDSSGLSDAETFTITVSEVNSAPVLAAIGAKSVAELAELAFIASASDSDIPASTPLAFSLDQAAQDAGMHIDASTGAFSWTPTEAQGPGAFSATVTVTDTTGLSDFETIQITVSEVNSQHTFSNPADQLIDEEAAWTFAMSGYLSDGDLPAGIAQNSFTYALDTAPSGAAIDASSGLISWTPSEAQGPGAYDFVVTASDQAVPALTASASFQVTVSEVDRSPLIVVEPAYTIAEGSLLQFEVDIYDPDNVETVGLITISGLPTGMSATSRNETIGGIAHTITTLAWTPSEDQGPGSYTITYTAEDAGSPALNAEASTVITVTEVNLAPSLTLNDVPASPVDELTAVSFTALGADTDLPSQTLVYSLSGAPAGASIDEASGVFSWTPGELQGAGSYSFAVNVSDGVTTTSEDVRIDVLEVNHAVSITAVNGSLTIPEETPASWTLTVSDSDLLHGAGSLPGSTYSFVLSTSPATSASIDAATGAIHWTPAESDGPGSYEFTVRAADSTFSAVDGEPLGCASSDVRCALVAFTVNVEEVLTQPGIQPVPDIVVDEGQLVEFTLRVSDVDLPANSLVVTTSSLPAGAAFDADSLTFSWQTGEADGPGVYTITFTVDDGTVQFSLVNSIDVKITVNAVNDLSLSVSESDDPILRGQVLYYTLTVSNHDPDPASGLVVTASIPSETSFEAGQSSSACTAGAAPNTVTCTLGSLAGYGASDLIAAVRVPSSVAEGTQLNFSASLTATESDPQAGNNTTSAQTTVRASNVIYEDDFSGGSSGQWSDGSTSLTPSGRAFLGEFNNQSVTLTLPGDLDSVPAIAQPAASLPSHTQVEISFDLFILRSWDGNMAQRPSALAGMMTYLQDDSIIGPDVWEFVVDGQILTHTTFSNWNSALFRQSYPGPHPEGDYPSFSGSAEFASLGYDFRGVPGMDAVYSMKYRIPHTADTLTLTFRDLGLQSIEDEAWGLDNIKIVLYSDETHKYFLPMVRR